MHTAIGYWFHEDIYKNGTECITRQNQIYSEAGYGARNWDVYARIGVADLKIPGAYSPSSALTTISKNDFEENWKIFGTVGAKVFLPFNRTFGMGAFIQGSYDLNNFTDSVSGSDAGAPYTATLKVKDRWDVNFGIGLQATGPCGVRLYAGPHVRYSEATAFLSSNIPGLKFTTVETKMNNKTNAGGFAGFDLPLGKGFRMNAEGQYSERFSAGASVTYTY